MHLKMEVSVGDVVMPGDCVKEISHLNKTDDKIVIGPGLRREGDKVTACKCGVLKKRGNNIYYVDYYQKRYIPSRGEHVIGVVSQKTGDIFKVDIGAHEPASLSYLSFESASKRNRPDVQVGDVVYAKLLIASKHMESELVCVDSFGKKGKLGVLDANGMLFSCSMNLVRKILKPECTLFDMLAKQIKYEIAVGMNGRIWVKSKSSLEDCVAVANAILAYEYKLPKESDEMSENDR